MHTLNPISNITYESGNNPFVFVTVGDGTKRFFGPYNVVDIYPNGQMTIHEYPHTLREFPNIKPSPTHKLFATIEIFGNKMLGLLYNSNFDVVVLNIDFDVDPEIRYLTNNAINISVSDGKLYCFPDNKSKPIMVYNEHFELMCPIQSNLSGVIFAFGYRNSHVVFRETSKTVDILDKDFKNVRTFGNVQDVMFDCVKGFIHLGDGYIAILKYPHNIVIFEVRSRCVVYNGTFDYDMRAIKYVGDGYIDAYSYGVGDNLTVTRFKFE